MKGINTISKVIATQTVVDVVNEDIRVADEFHCLRDVHATTGQAGNAGYSEAVKAEAREALDESMAHKKDVPDVAKSVRVGRNVKAPLLACVLNKEGKVADAEHFDVGQLEVIKAQTVKVTPRDTGGPMPSPKRQVDPRR